MENGKIKVLVVPSDKYGVGLYRSVSPHTQLERLYPDKFDIDIEYTPNYRDHASFDKYDLIHIHKGLYGDMEGFWGFLDYCKSKGITTVMDIDDNWEVGQQHPLYAQNKRGNVAQKILQNIKRFDYVTTTTDIFASKIRKYNTSVKVFPNAVDPEEEQYKPIKNPSDKIRFGFVMGSSHQKDMEQIQGVFGSLPKEILDKIQVVLCGFDLRGVVNEMSPDGSIIRQRPVKPTESVWYSYEKTCTDNYRLCSPEYKEFLHKFLRNVQYPGVENEPYRREWTKGLDEFAKHYRNIDVLLAPLDTNQFNEVKSELKLIEGGFTKTAVICTDFGPYSLIGNSMFKFGGEIDETGNCILIDPAKKHKAWKKSIVKLVENPELITKLQNNLYETVKDKYDIRNVTDERAAWYESIARKNG